MVERIKQVMDYEQMSPTAFADKININRSSLTHIFSGRNQPSLDVAKKILVAFPEISTEWLIMGMGEMLQPISAEPDKPVTKTVDNMQQTDLFSGTEDALVHDAATKVADDEPIMDSKGEETTVEIDEKDIPAETEDAQPIVEQVVTEPRQTNEPSVRPTRGRTRVSESRISAVGPRRERILNSPSDKKIVKIVFFYEDRSFEEYRPS